MRTETLSISHWGQSTDKVPTFYQVMAGWPGGSNLEQILNLKTGHFETLVGPVWLEWLQTPYLLHNMHSAHTHSSPCLVFSPSPAKFLCRAQKTPWKWNDLHYDHQSQHLILVLKHQPRTQNTSSKASTSRMMATWRKRWKRGETSHLLPTHAFLFLNPGVVVSSQRVRGGVVRVYLRAGELGQQMNIGWVGKIKVGKISCE